MHGSSRTWKSPEVKDRERNHAQEHARRKVCPKSPFWHADLDIEAHRKEWEAGRMRIVKQKAAREIEAAAERLCVHGKGTLPPPPVRTPFNGKNFSHNLSPVLCTHTIFCPAWQEIKAEFKVDIAPWPSKQEMRYEGEDRISTDRLHRRFLPYPREESNETVNWQHRRMVPQFRLDDLYYPTPDAFTIFFRLHWVPELEFTDEEGTRAIGHELMQLLDPQDQ